MATVYEINRGVNRSIVFKGVKAQYIIYLALGLVLLLLLFAILYLVHVSLYICMGLVLPTGGGLLIGIKKLSNRFGEHGLLKYGAARRLPSSVRSRSRKIFLQLKSNPDEKA